MKIKRFFSLIGLSLFGAVSVGAGLLAAPKKAAETNAEGEKWMFRAQLCLGSLSPDHDPTPWGDNYIEKVSFRYWGENIDGPAGGAYELDVPLMFYSSHDYYAINVSLQESQVITGAQWRFHQYGKDGDEYWKYSVVIDRFGSSDNDRLDKDSPYTGIQWQVSDSLISGSGWTDGKWTFNGNIYGAATENITMDVGIGTYKHYDFQKEPANNVLAIRNVELNQGDAIGWSTQNSFVFSSKASALVDTLSRKYLDAGIGGHPNWWYHQETGTFDFILGNNTLSIYKHSDAENTYIYYVLENNVATNDYIYTWGGSEQFGAWHGTKITEIEGVEEVSGNGVLHFEGSDTPKLIYKIPVKIGYPVGDLGFKFNNGSDVSSSTEGELSAHAAYWFDAICNQDAGAAIDFLVEAEEYRNSAEDYSVCNVSKDNAAALVAKYNSLSESIRGYIDSSKVHTYTAQDMSSEGLVSYKSVVERLGMIGEVEVVGSSIKLVSAPYTRNSNMTILIVTISAIVCTSTVAILFVVKKRKHQ